MAKPPGALTYTQMLNAKGGIECDLTVARLAEDRFYIVTGTGFATHDSDWIARNIPDGLDARLLDVHLGATPCCACSAPAPATCCAACTRDDLSNAAFPFATCREITVAGAPVLALRVTYVGELGWELHVPVEFAATVYDALMEAGQRARHRQRRLPRHRIAAPGEGLSRLGLPTSAPTTRRSWPASAGP